MVCFVFNMLEEIYLLLTTFKGGYISEAILHLKNLPDSAMEESLLLEIKDNSKYTSEPDLIIIFGCIPCILFKGFKKKNELKIKCNESEMKGVQLKGICENRFIFKNSLF
jgi:hypothetical protein